MRKPSIILCISSLGLPEISFKTIHTPIAIHSYSAVSVIRIEFVEAFNHVCVFVTLVIYLVAHTEGIVDTLGQSMPVSTAKKKQRRRTIKERRDIVEETLVPGASAAYTPNTMMSAAKVC